MIRPRRIKVAIDRLVLQAGDPRDAAALRRAFVAELTARLAEADASAIAAQGSSVPPRLAIGAGDASQLGSAAGRALAGTLGAPAAGRRR